MDIHTLTRELHTKNNTKIVLYVADGSGDVWRSTDLATFDRVAVPGGVEELKSVGTSVMGRSKENANRKRR